MAITGVHTILYTPEAEALRDVLREVFGWRHVDARDGWLIFALPPAEMGVHPGEWPSHQVSFMCDDLDATVADLRTKGIVFEGSPRAAGFGVSVTMVLPGGVRVMLYQPRPSDCLLVGRYRAGGSALPGAGVHSSAPGGIAGAGVCGDTGAREVRA